MERRLGHDFGAVRVHTDAHAADSAAAVASLAYTVGNHVVVGRAAMSGEQGRRVLAHELIHTIQQAGQPPGLGPLPVSHQSDPSEREAEHVAQMALSQAPTANVTSFASVPALQRACGPSEIGSPPGCAERSGDIADFGATSEDLFFFARDCDAMAVGESARLADYVTRIRPEDTVTIDGFASEEGSAQFNMDLSCARARAAVDVLLAAGVAPSSLALYAHGATPGDRPIHRSVVITVTSPAQEAPTPRAPAEAPKFLCGPDVTSALASAVSDVGARFSALNMDDKVDNCLALVYALEGGLISWDIVELHNRNWIWQQYRPPCASAGATPPCGETVQVGKECYYGGSPNYVVFGYMMRRCHEDYGGAYPAVSHVYTRSAMLETVDEYKGPGSILGEGSNWPTARAWAAAGYDGWPAGGTPPAADRPGCSPQCPTAFTTPGLHARWCPHIDPFSQCPKYTRVAF